MREDDFRSLNLQSTGMLSTALLDPLFTTARMRDVFSDHGRVQAMLDFEAALARAQARVGMIAEKSSATIAAACKARTFDIVALGREAAAAGNPLIPLVKALAARVAKVDPDAARYVHWGATSQDALDTGLVLQIREGLTEAESQLARLSSALTQLTARHRHTVMAGRTLMQQAVPITLGLKAAGWMDAIERHRTRMQEMRVRTLVLQFGGAAGSLAALGERSQDVAKALAEELKLALPSVSWHSHRDRLAETATMLGILVGTLGKIARDVSLLSQTEIGEAFEPGGAGRGGSSTMPHKRNPVRCAIVLAAAARTPGLVSTMLSAMVQEHERGLGGWHAEWETLPQIFTLAGGALDNLTAIVEGLEVDPARMRENLDITHGLVMAEAISMALAAKLGRQESHDIVEGACREAVEQQRPLREVLSANRTVAAQLSAKDLDRLFDPANYLGAALSIIDGALQSSRKK
jgi:3-carboxy-cis,cis-muconate cycloisomerase